MAGLFLKIFLGNCPALILFEGYQVRTGIRVEDIPPAEPLDRVDSLGLPLHLIFVDNGSRDGTLEFLASRLEITVS